MDPKIKFSIGDVTFLIGALITMYMIMLIVQQLVKYPFGSDPIGPIVLGAIGFYLMGKSKLN